MFLLICVLCLALLACSKESKYADLEKMLDEGRYSDALAYILALQSNNGGPNLGGLVGIPDDSGNNDTNTAPEIDDETQTLLDALIGDWVYTGTEEEAPKAFTFREDGTCTVDGTALTWKYHSYGFISSTISNSSKRKIVYIRLFDGDTATYEIRIDRQDSGETKLNCSRVLADGDIVAPSYNYICPDRYEIIELTKDNWKDYFEWTEEFFHSKDAFGDVTSRGTSYCFTLKEEYFDRLSQYASSKGAVEIVYSTANYGISVNDDGITYTKKGGVVDIGYTGGTHTYTTDLSKHHTDTYFGAWYCSKYVWEPDEHFDGNLSGKLFCEYMETHKVTRIQGTIYLLKEQ